MFPQEEVHRYRVLKNCSNCSRRLNEINNESLLKCNSCNLTASAINVKSSHAANLYFKKECIAVTMYPDKINQFLKLVNATNNSEKIYRYIFHQREMFNFCTIAGSTVLQFPDIFDVTKIM